MRTVYRLFLAIILLPAGLAAQALQPGFSKSEYIELLKVNNAFMDSSKVSPGAHPTRFRKVYRSPAVGMDNCWDLWTDGSVAVISIRGTTAKSISWMENFYSAMVPAQGTLTLSPTHTFSYKLADDPKAAVHTGWLIGMAFLSEDILPKIDSCYKQGIKDYLIMGHSQGGAICYLMTSYLLQLKKEHRLPEDIRFKTYGSAGPKPGNLYYAYDYENATRGGWAFNVVNSADWVPEVPLSIQTATDFNTVNPFIHARPVIRKQKFPKNIALKYIYNNLDKPTRKALRKYKRFLGAKVSHIVEGYLKGFKRPVFFNSFDYVRTGSIVVLYADEAYYKLFPNDTHRPFIHHMFEPYMYLANKLDTN